MTEIAAHRTTEKHHILTHPDFPQASKYDPSWVFENEMGPNVLWLTEWLTREMNIQPGMRVLDMGCGKAISSIFLAEAFKVQVFANDLWIPATDNWQRICEAGVEARVFPIHAEAHALPYAEGFFDCIVSMDSYHYYGTDQLYLGYFHKFLKPGGEIGIVVPGLHKELHGKVPEHLKRKQKSGGVFWAWDMCSFHTAAWWEALWSQYPFVDVTHCESMTDGGHLWLQWEQALDAAGGKKAFPSDIETLEADDNRNLTFVRLIAKRNSVRI